jgi:hypothetical protein
MDSQQIVEALENAGYEPHAYSGRGMYGRQCVAVDVEYLGDGFALGFALGADHQASPGTPDSDAMGKGFVLYWPNLEWPKETRE